MDKLDELFARIEQSRAYIRGDLKEGDGPRYTHRVTTDGIEVSDTVLTLRPPKIIPHDMFRKWTYQRGYWNEAYYKFLEDIRPVIVNIYVDEQGWPDEE